MSGNQRPKKPTELVAVAEEKICQILKKLEWDTKISFEHMEISTTEGSNVTISTGLDQH